MSSSQGDKKDSDVEMGEATSPAPVLTSPAEAPACVAGHLSFREELRPSGTIARSLRSDRALARARSLHRDQTGRSFGRCVATELWLELGRYVATEPWLELGRYVATELWLKLGRYVATERDERSVTTYMLSSTRSNKESQLIFSPDPANLERTIRKEASSLSTDNNSSVSLDSAQPSSTQTPVPSTNSPHPYLHDQEGHLRNAAGKRIDAQGDVIPEPDAFGLFYDFLNFSRKISRVTLIETKREGEVNRAQIVLARGRDDRRCWSSSPIGEVTMVLAVLTLGRGDRGAGRPRPWAR
ncbi:hypothetical protein F2Q69_00014030 [Brassica cretica]|uniref:Uncharacterized protein n=1 Tax=Brassica cretica TaxID=69181 RepID=A0A8S9QVN4_BRACR|nr:hypothetical protein F2Q69_00014030 [Brassica cretica]